jgi:hypothetical protein
MNIQRHGREEQTREIAVMNGLPRYGAAMAELFTALLHVHLRGNRTVLLAEAWAIGMRS